MPIREQSVMSVVSGIEHRSAEQLPVATLTVLMVSMAIPPALVVVGMIALGWSAVDWGSAIVWGVIATVAFRLFSMLGTAMGMTQMDLLDCWAAWSPSRAVAPPAGRVG
jgi:hypothetical protein